MAVIVDGLVTPLHGTVSTKHVTVNDEIVAPGLLGKPDSRNLILVERFFILSL
jgi:hypothetical protein